MNNQELLDLVKKTSGDPDYQTIEINDVVIKKGYSQCWMTWENILKTKIDFKDKSVCDIGCFNGYFSIKAKKAGAKSVVGIDQNDPALVISKNISEMNNMDCEFIKKIVGKDILFEKQYDIIMALNMLHHVRMASGEIVHKQVIDSIIKNSKESIFEVNADEIPAVIACINENNASYTTRVSHRKTQFGDRTVFYVKN